MTTVNNRAPFQVTFHKRRPVRLLTPYLFDEEVPADAGDDAEVGEAEYPVHDPERVSHALTFLPQGHHHQWGVCR